MGRLRLQRVNELVQRVIAESVARRLNSEMTGFVTISSVDTNRDFSHADVYFSVFGSDEDVERAQEALDSAKPELQAVIGKEVRLRNTPQLNFIHDDGEVRAARIDRLLDKERSMRETKQHSAHNLESQ